MRWIRSSSGPKGDSDMAITDGAVQHILETLERYKSDHPQAEIEAYRQNPVSIRIRVIDPDFRGVDEIDREDIIWPLLDELDEEVRADITLVLLLTPEETKKSFANLEFNNPIPSGL